MVSATDSPVGADISGLGVRNAAPPVSHAALVSAMYIVSLGTPVAVTMIRLITKHGAAEVRRMPHGKICYLEIPANKAEDAAAFYSTMFGWTVRPRGDGNLAFDDSGSVSGTWVKESDRTPDERTRVYIMVDSIAESLEQIQAAGGKVLTPRKDIGPNMGAFAAFADPVGNEFGLYEEPHR